MATPPLDTKTELDEPAAIEADYCPNDYVAHDEPAANREIPNKTAKAPAGEVNNFASTQSSEAPALNLADYDAMEAFPNLLPSTWDKADALGRAKDTVALREAANHDTAQAQLEAIEGYH